MPTPQHRLLLLLPFALVLLPYYMQREMLEEKIICPEAQTPTKKWTLLLATWRHRFAAFGTAVPTAVLVGLIGLGGSEFLLPVLAGPLCYSAWQAVPLNLLISLITISAAVVTRASTRSLEPLAALLPGMIGLVLAGAVTAFLGTALVHRLTDEYLTRIILVLLIGIGSALIMKGFLPKLTSPQ